MTNAFPRIVSGYLTSEELHAYGTVEPGTDVYYQRSGQHGEINGWQITPFNGSMVDFTNIFLKLTIDTNIIFDDRHYALYCALPMYNFHGGFASCDVMGGNWSKVEFKWNIPFENSFEVRLYATSGAGNTLELQVFTRIGG